MSHYFPLAIGTFKMKAVARDTHLEGEDFNNILLKHFIDILKRQYKEDINGNARALRRLKCTCERAKLILSSAVETRSVQPVAIAVIGQ